MMTSNFCLATGKGKCIDLYRLPVVLLFFIAGSCSLSKKIDQQAATFLYQDSIIRTGHIGISIYEPATKKYWYEHDATAYFLPASNTKLFTLYAALKYLGDSLAGLRYRQNENGITIYPTADPTFLDPDFIAQPVFEFLKTSRAISYRSQLFTDGLGKGWAWDDYLESYMAQRSEFPVYGNLIRVYNRAGILSSIPATIRLEVQNRPERYSDTTGYSLSRSWNNNDVIASATLLHPAKNMYAVPLVPGLLRVPEFLADTLKQKITFITDREKDSIDNTTKKLYTIYSRPTDSLLQPMLYNSDNFFAEQSLLMVSNEHLGYMSIDAVIDTLLKKELRDVPQKPRWVDGSGLSRYNLFTPRSLVYILNKTADEFGVERLKRLLPTGGQGTLKNYFLNDSTFIFAKTGSLSNNSAISGLMYSKKGRLLIFTIVANQFIGSATKVRHAVEHFLEAIRNKY